MGWIEVNRSDIMFYQCQELNDNQVIQAFSTRDSGNMALHIGDNPARVVARRESWLKALGLNPDRLIAGVQVHGIRVAAVGEEDVGSGARDFDEAIPETDALITRTPGIVLATFTADCLPIFIYDPFTPSIGIVHAGWRGTIGGIVGVTLERMRREFGANPRNCRIAIGPSICGRCFQVERVLAERFRAAYRETVTDDQSGSKVDLKAFVQMDLKKLGVDPNHIFNAGICTSCRPDLFFSYRAERGTTGRMMGIIYLK